MPGKFVSCRVDEETYNWIHSHKNPSEFVRSLLLKARFPEKEEGKLDSGFNYDKWYVDCPFGTYLKEEKKVFCRCHYKTVTKWRGHTHLVDPRVCEQCFSIVNAIMQKFNLDYTPEAILDKPQREFITSQGVFCKEANVYISQPGPICPTCNIPCPYSGKSRPP